MTTSKLDAIAARLEAARSRSEETLRDLPEYRLLSRAEADRQRLVRDTSELLAVVREVAAAIDRADPPGRMKAGTPTVSVAQLRSALAPLTKEETDGR